MIFMLGGLWAALFFFVQGISFSKEHISMSIFCSSIMLPPFILFFGAVAPNPPPRGRFGAFGAGSHTTRRVHRQSRSCSSPGSDRRCPGTSRPWCHGRSSWSQYDAIFFVMGVLQNRRKQPVCHAEFSGVFLYILSRRYPCFHACNPKEEMLS